ncbi:MAG: biotin--[acetyl-CoA-carboxylase] ligase [Nitrospira sp.]|nr:biotin--[acetyl-CoA-carboxylase] ligase [Nitrospira sp.]MDH5252371.1 biotin--[acetyl-CoA-carboxylase] ligase [Nitrospira sp.]
MSLSAPLTLDNIRSTLATTSFGQCLHLYQELPSTNSEALALAQAGAAHGTVVVAESQSAGKGRRTRAWHSPPGANIYCSIVVRGIGREGALAEWLSWVPLTSALAVAEAVQITASLSLSLKWPNDLLLHERKVGGILCESSHVSAKDPIVVIGIGLNVNMPHESFPDELRPIATSLFEVSRRLIDRNRLIAQLLFELEQGLDELRSHGAERLRRAYTARCGTLGKRVRVLMGPEQELLGTAESISTDGALQIRPVPSSPTTPPLIGVRAADVIHLRE